MKNHVPDNGSYNILVMLNVGNLLVETPDKQISLID